MTAVIDGFESFFDGLGLMTGEFAVPKRALIGALAGGFLVTYFKPASMFENGNPKYWSMIASEKDGPTTMIPWYAAPVAGAFIAAVLI